MVDRVQEIKVFGTTSQEKIRFRHSGRINGNSPRVGFPSQLRLDKDENHHVCSHACPLTHIRVSG